MYMYITCTFVCRYRSTAETTEDKSRSQEQTPVAVPETSNPVIQSGGGGGDLIGDLLSLDIPTQPTYTAPMANIGMLWALIRVTIYIPFIV